MIHIYESRTAPANRRYIAHCPEIKGNVHLVIYGPTAENVTARANLMLEYQKVPVIDRKAFDLKGRLAAIGGEQDAFDDEDLL